MSCPLCGHPGPTLLDLFCGAGGCTRGYQLAGFHVTGVDNRPQPRYIGDHFIQADALTYPLDGFDAIHASPPCQSETDLRRRWGRDNPDLLTPTLAALAELDLSWVVENVDSTRAMSDAITLCGASFELGAWCKDGVWRPVRRHRRFASNVPMLAPPCACTGRQPLGVYGNGGGGMMTRGYKATLAEAREALGIGWMNRAEISQAIPPAYTQYVGEQLLSYLKHEPTEDLLSGRGL